MQHQLRQVQVPLWTRAWRIQHAYAYAVVDLLFTVCWFTAFVSVATWNADGISKGKAGLKESGAGGCSAFAYGSAGKCNTSKAIVGLGVLIL